VLGSADCNIYGGMTFWRSWRTALSQIISLLDEDEHAWVMSPSKSVTGSDVDGSTMSVVVIVTWSIGGVDIEMSTYGRVTQSRSVIEKKNKRLTVVDG
jgi:hypothetical protein